MRSVRLPQTLRSTKRPTSTTDMKVKRYLLWCPSRAVKKKKKSSFHQKLSVVFCLFLLVPRSSLEKKANGPVECAQPAGCAQKGAAYWFLHVSIGNNVRKKGRKGELQMGENVWDAAMRYRRLFSQQCSGSFFPPSLVVSQLIPPRVSWESTGVFVAGQRMGSGRQESGLRGADREGGVRE